jgi:hypothetical protein
MTVVVDGTKQSTFETIGQIGLYFSPDSKNIAYIGKKSGMRHVVVNEKLSKGFRAIGSEGLRFSEDWKKVIFNVPHPENDLLIPVIWSLEEDNYVYDEKDAFYLGQLYDSNGNYEQAALYYEQAANSGSFMAQYNLGSMYREGVGVPQDYKTAFKWLLKSANQGYTRAIADIGIMHYTGNGLKQDYKTARVYLEIAALNDNEMAQAYLGLMHANGQGVKQNKDLAIKWLTKAANKGNKIAITNLQLLKTQKERDNERWRITQFPQYSFASLDSSWMSLTPPTNNCVIFCEKKGTGAHIGVFLHELPDNRELKDVLDLYLMDDPPLIIRKLIEPVRQLEDGGFIAGCESEFLSLGKKVRSSECFVIIPTSSSIVIGCVFDKDIEVISNRGFPRDEEYKTL